jgi:hypothetical protein
MILIDQAAKFVPTFLPLSGKKFFYVRAHSIQNYPITRKKFAQPFAFVGRLHFRGARASLLHVFIHGTGGYPSAGWRISR